MDNNFEKKIPARKTDGLKTKNDFCPYCMSFLGTDRACPVCGLTKGAYQPSPYHLPPGIILQGRYLVGRVLGEGGFGITYIGCDLRLEMKVAIKEYFPQDHVSRISKKSLSVVTSSVSGAHMGMPYGGANTEHEYEKGLKRFLVEARTMARMEKQPEIVMVRDFFEANNTAYIIMEYVDGTTFSNLVEQNGGRIEPQKLFDMMEPLFGALGNVHTKGLLHRDISPDNLMLEQGKIRLLDFGCAREVSTGNETLTVALKQGYGPIEQYQKKGQGPWTDVYALSATIYFCLTGKKPPQALDRTLDDELVPPRELGVKITPEQQKALLKGMAVNPKLRYQSVEELYGGLYENADETQEDETGKKPGIPPVTEEIEIEDTADDTVNADVNDKTDDTADDEAKNDRTDDTAGSAKEPLAENPGFGILSFVKEHKKPCGILCAAVLVLLVALGVHTRLTALDTVANTNGVDNRDTGDDAASDEAEATGSGFDRSFADAIKVSDAESLRDALDNDDVTSIIITDFIEITSEQLEITKPVRISSGTTLRSDQAVTVSGNGFVDVQGELDVEQGLLCLMDDCCVVVEDGGALGIWMLWAAREEDLSLEAGASLNLYGQDSLEAAEAEGRCLFLDEDGLFLDAEQVSTKEELLSALDDSDTEAVRIVAGSEITLSEDEVIRQIVPILIEDGASVTIPGSTSDGNDNWFVEGTELVNYGDLTANLQGRDNGESLFAIVNYGEMNLERLCFEAQGHFINAGSLELGTTAALYGDFINLGTADFTGGEETYFFDFRDNVLFNYGTLTLTGRKEAEAYISVNNRLVNAGTIEVCEYAGLSNYGILENKGTIAFHDSTAKIDGCGWVESCAPASCILAEDDCQIDVGILTYSDKDTVAGVENFIDQTINASDYGAEIVSTQSELEKALKSGSVDVIKIDDELTAESSLTVNKRVIIYGDLDIEGTLTVGEGGSIMAYGSLSGSSLVVADGAAVACRGDFSFGDVEVKNGTLAAAPYGSVEIGSSLAVGNSGQFILLASAKLSDAEISIKNGAVFTICGELSLTDCDVAVAEGGEILYRHAGDLFLNEGSMLENYGKIDFNNNHWIYNIEIACEIQNYGRLNLSDSMVNLSGSLTNYGSIYVDNEYADDGYYGFVVTGALDNQGELYIRTDGKVEIVTDGGTFTGNAAMAGSAYE